MKPIHLLIVSFLLLIIGQSGQAQEGKRIRLIQAGELKPLGTEIRRLIGNVILEHDSTLMHCDSAYLNDKVNTMEAFGHVHIIVNDTLNLYGDYLNYDGNTRLAKVHKNVRLVDNETTLTTDLLHFHRPDGIAQYFSGGTIVNKENTLVSLKGYYYTKIKEFYFKNEVVLTNPDYIVHTDTLRYSTQSRMAWLLGPSTIESGEDSLYCESGYYNTPLKRAHVSQRAFLRKEGKTLQADSLVYDRLHNSGRGIGHVTLIDTAKSTILKGHYTEYEKAFRYSFLTDSALAILYDQQDSLFLHADTLRAIFDSTGATKNLFAYHHTRFFRHDIQGACDSMTYNLQDSVIALYSQPTLWAEENQMTADSILIVMKNEQIDHMNMYNSAFIISQDTDTLNYNQIKGKNMTAYFRNNEIYRVAVEGNAETIYFVREEDGSLNGINKGLSGRMNIHFVEKKIEGIDYISQPVYDLWPESELPEKMRELKGFRWMGNIRPHGKADVFKR